MKYGSITYFYTSKDARAKKHVKHNLSVRIINATAKKVRGKNWNLKILLVTQKLKII